jgi:hypothetical protein
MSSMETISDDILANPETLAITAQKQTKRMFIGFAATITIGLAIAGWYVGGRIFAAEKAHPIVIAKAVPSAPVIVKPTTSAQAWNTVDPKSGDLYLQLAALGTNSTNEYLKTLNAKGIHPHIAPGPSEGLHRILIGPYADKAALKKELQALRTAGIETFVRAY